MRTNRTLLVAAVTIMTGLVPFVGTSPASAKGSTPSPAPASPPPGWVVDRVRVEPVDPKDEIVVAGVGAYRGAIEIGRQPRPPTAAKTAAKVTTKTTTKAGRAGAKTATTVAAPTTSAPASNVPPPAGPIVIVNDVSIDDYVKGIAEVPNSWPAEALKAQAIAARTYALHELAVGRKLCATESCQVYAGVAKERAPGGENWVAAVLATSGQVLQYKGQPILAMYSSSNGGRSVAGSEPYLTANDDPDDEVAPVSQWQISVPFDTLTSVFGTPQPVIDAQRTARDTVEIIWNNEDGSTGSLDIPSNEFGRRMNGSMAAPPGMPRPFPSMRVSAVTDQQAGTITFFGQGFGHGIGMSQYGAKGKADRGMAAGDILAAYYGGIQPAVDKKLPASIKVTLDGGRSGPVTVTSPGRFRLVGPDGRQLAVLASGSWQIVPGTTTVRVVPPPDQAGAPTVAVTGVDTPAGVPAKVGFRLGGAAVVSVLARAAGRLDVSAGPVVMEPGDRVLTLPTSLPDGDWSFTLTADAGGGRTTVAPSDIRVGPPPPAPLPQGQLPIEKVTPAAALATAGAGAGAPRRGGNQGITLAMAMTFLAGLTLAGAVAHVGLTSPLDADPPVPRLV